MKMDISVIIPAYNAGKYIENCIQSILRQDYPVKEIIVIDDGSTDDTLEKCKFLSSSDERIKVVHTSNQGVSAARNYGLSIVSGDLVSFIDADDWLEDNMYSTMVSAMLRDGADIALTGYVKHRKDGNVVHSLDSDRLYTSQKALFEIIRDDVVNSLSPTFLFTRSCIGDLRYPVGRRHFEDTLFIYKVIERCHRVVHVKDPLYHYMRHGESALGDWPLFVALSFVEAHQVRLDDLSIRRPEMIPVAFRSYYRVFKAAKKHLKTKEETDLNSSFRLIRKSLAPFYRRNAKTICRVVKPRLSERVGNIMFLLFPSFYRIFR